MQAPQYRHIGQPTRRKDAREIVTGRAEYIDDLKMSDLLHAKVLRSPHAHAEIVSIDVSKAEALPGVAMVLTHHNAPDWRLGAPRDFTMLSSKVRFPGDAVAVVGAESPEIAEQALDLIDVEYNPLPAVFTAREALEPGAPQLYEQYPGNLLPGGYPPFGPNALSEIVRGDVEAGFAEADFVVDGTSSYENMPNPLPLEPPGVIVRWDGPNKLTAWSAAQSAGWHRFVMLVSLGFPDIRSISTHCGGSFGSKNYAGMPFMYAAALAKVTSRPVKIFYGKAEHMAAFVVRPGSQINARIGMKKDGRLTAIQGEWLMNTGAFSDMTPAQVAVGLGEAQLLLSCPNWDLVSKLVVTNRNPAGVVRGFGGQELEAALEPVVSEAMIAAKLDPVEFFKVNFVRPGQTYVWREGRTWTYRGLDFRPAMEKGAQAFGWREKFKGWLTPTSVDGPRRTGVGVWVHGNADIGEDESEAWVKLNPDGTATVHVLVSEAGMGTRSSMAKMAAEVLGLPLEKVDLSEPDTLANPFEFGLVGSRGTYAVGSAVIKAAEEARRKLLEKAAPLFKTDAEDLDTVDGKVFTRLDPAKKLSWSKILGISRTVTGIGCFEADFSLTNFLMLFAEVAVDVETGKVDLTKLTLATDVGQIIDPQSLAGQLNGCFGSAGLDTATFEEVVLDPKHGWMLNPNLVDYKWRTFAELPPCEHVVLESQAESHRFKAFGVGEIATSPGPAAVLMAVSNALGVRLSEYPLTPEKVLAAWKQAGGEAAK